MSTVDNDVTCQNCGFEEANESFNNRSMVATTFCQQCGLYHELNYVTSDEKTEGGFGSFRVEYNHGLSRGGGFNQAVSLATLKRDFKWAMRNLAVKRVAFCLPDGAGWKTIAIKDFPKSGRQRFRKPKVTAAMARFAPNGQALAEFSEDIPF